MKQSYGRENAMIRMENQWGLIEVTPEYFNEIVGSAVSGCYGVASMGGTRQLLPLPKRWRAAHSGVRVFKQDKGVMVDLHVTVKYGLNISAVVRSIVSRVSHTVEGATGLPVQKVNVFVDGMLREESVPS